MILSDYQNRIIVSQDEWKVKLKSEPSRDIIPGIRVAYIQVAGRVRVYPPLHILLPGLLRLLRLEAAGTVLIGSGLVAAVLPAGTEAGGPCRPDQLEQLVLADVGCGRFPFRLQPLGV